MVLTRIFAIPWAIKIPACNDISLVKIFLSNRTYTCTLKNVIFQITQTKILFPQTWEAIEHLHEPLLFVILYRVYNGISLIAPLYQWMQLSVACLVAYSSVLFHSCSLLNVAAAHQTLTELHQPCSSNSIAVAHRTLIELQLTVLQPCSSNLKPMPDGTHEHQTVYFLLQCWQDVVTVKCAKRLYMYNPYIIACHSPHWQTVMTESTFRTIPPGTRWKESSRECTQSVISTTRKAATAAVSSQWLEYLTASCFFLVFLHSWARSPPVEYKAQSWMSIVEYHHKWEVHELVCRMSCA